jgi:hypothetical protein
MMMVADFGAAPLAEKFLCRNCDAQQIDGRAAGYVHDADMFRDHAGAALL